MEGFDIIFGFIDWAVAAVFIGLGFWPYNKPTLALTIGLIVYCTLILLFLAIEPTTIFRGVIWKVLIILALVNGIKTAKAEQKNTKSSSSDLLDDF